MAYKSYFDSTVSGTPNLILDERVVVNTPVVIDTVTYYLGYLYEQTDETIKGSSSTTTGAYTAALKAGTRYNVVLNSLPGTEEVQIDFLSGRVLCNSSVVLYFNYYGYGRLYKWYEIGGELRHLADMFCDMVADTVIYQEQVNYATRFVGGQVISRIAQFSATFTMRVKNNTTGSYQDVTLTAGQEYGISSFATALEFQKYDILQIIILANTSGVQSPTLILYRG